MAGRLGDSRNPTRSESVSLRGSPLPNRGMYPRDKVFFVIEIVIGHAQRLKPTGEIVNSLAMKEIKYA